MAKKSTAKNNTDANAGKTPKGYKAITPITHDGKPFAVGDKMPTLSKVDLDALLNFKAVEPFFE